MLTPMSSTHEYVESLGVPIGSRHRSDCAFCGHKNSFAAYNDGVHVIFKCFHADCNVKGRIRTRLTSDSFTAIVQPEVKSSSEFILPDTFVDVSKSSNAMQYLRSVNCMDAYLHGRIRVMYDKRLNRVAFMIRDRKRPVDAVGRALADIKPKWYRYGKSQQLFTAGTSDIAVLVEDCASASCVSHMVTGVAMLGTSILKDHIEQLKKYSAVYVALDKDATQLALKTVQTLKPSLNVRMLILEQDLKNMEGERRDDFIRRKTS